MLAWWIHSLKCKLHTFLLGICHLLLFLCRAPDGFRLFIFYNSSALHILSTIHISFCGCNFGSPLWVAPWAAACVSSPFFPFLSLLLLCWFNWICRKACVIWHIFYWLHWLCWPYNDTHPTISALISICLHLLPLFFPSFTPSMPPSFPYTIHSNSVLNSLFQSSIHPSFSLYLSV